MKCKNESHIFHFNEIFFKKRRSLKSEAVKENVIELSLSQLTITLDWISLGRSFLLKNITNDLRTTLT